MNPTEKNLLRRRLWPLGRNMCTRNRWLLMLILMITGITGIRADGYITDLVVIGRYGKTDANNMVSSYRNQGYTVLGKDLNAGSGSSSWYVYLGYKTSTSANPETGYVTDIIASTTYVNSIKCNGRNYSRVTACSDFNGDLNRGATGPHIYLYYTKERANLSGNGDQKRVLTGLSTSDKATSTSIRWYNDYSNDILDANKGNSGDYIYINMAFATQTLSIKNHPSFTSDFTFDGNSHLLIPNAPSGNYGTMKYKVNSGSWSTSLPKATNVGTYKVYYRLEATFANTSTEYNKTVTVNPPVVKPLNLNWAFNQKDKQVELTWSAQTLQGNYTDYWWVVYRDNTKIATLANTATGYIDKNYTTDSSPKYDVYYVSKWWGENTKKSEAMKSVTANARRSVPVDNFNAEGQADRVVLTWTSKGYPQNWGNKFNIYIDNETEPVYTITPDDNQSSFRWEHRSTDAHSDRKNGKDGNIHYTEEPLNGCSPHNYRVEGVIDNTVLNMASAQNKSVGNGTLFYSFDATKGVYPGTVKLNWHVDLQGSTASKTYIVERRVTEMDQEAWVTLHRMASTDEYLFYTDETPLPGVYYDYRITVQDKCDNGQLIYNYTTDIGFAQTTGTVSGRITFGETGTAVAGVDVKAVKTSTSGEELNQYYAMHFGNADATVAWQYDKEDYATKFNTGDFSMQMWVRPDAFTNKCIASLKDGNKGALGITNDGELYFSDGTNNYNFGLTLKTGIYQHVTLTRTGNELTCYLVESDANGLPVTRKSTKTMNGALNLSGATQFTLGNLNGYIDEFRLWTACLDSTAIVENFDHLLVGNEKDLETYWTFDEGLRTQFFDYARTGTVFHEHHGKIGGDATTESTTPKDLTLKAKTDENGNYLILGVPFNGEGTNYAIEPKMGVHQFNPQQHLRYVSNNSLVHNGVDFDDVSSFTVKGAVYYRNTNIPVSEAYLYVDGIMCSKDGEPIMTNSMGEYTISVPIGEHFFQVKKQGHVFSNNGRYPADAKGTGEKAEFDRDLSNITFYDETTVVVAGRVTGGDIEYEKQLGMGLSKNNIGKAQLKLSLSNENFIINNTSEERTFQADAGNVTAPAGANYLYVETDGTTGEWIAQLPPLRYEVTDLIMMKTRPEGDPITKQNFSLPVIDATNPNLIYTDSVEVDGEWQKFSYVASAKMEYKATSTLKVTENKNGTFGMKSYKVKDINGVEHEVALYDMDQDGNVVLDDNGKVKYTFGVTTDNPNGYPVYQELSKYTYKLYAYERYNNYDDGSVKVDEVPLAGKKVNIKNQYASTTSVKTGENELGDVYEVMSDELELDDNGEAYYMFTAGFPNIQGDYTRGLSISYDNGGTPVDWDQNGKFRVLILGGLPTGNNFVTQGPDEVLMVLRDPPGTGSQTTWSKGTSVTKTKTTTSEYNNNTGVNSIIYAGVKAEQGVGGVGFMVISDLDSKVNFKVGAEYFCTRTSGNTTTSVTTTTRDISTSDAMDFVGASGDVFIGSSKNIIFGACRAVDIKWDNANNEAKLVQEDAIAMGEEFTTGFNYDQNYIKNVLIPNFETLRNKLITEVTSVSGVDRPAKGEKEAKYVSTLSTDDPRFGSSNSDYDVWGADTVQFSSMKNGVYSGPSYTMLLPVDYEKDLDGVQDMVNFYNVQIKKWEEALANNEKAKVDAMNDRKKYLKENHSFSAGASITQTVTSDQGEAKMSATSDGFNITLGLETGYRFSGLGLGVEVTEQNGGTWTEENSTETVHSTSMSYTLMEDGDDDYLSVDVYNAPDNFGPIFVTRGGATSCPFEDEVVTEYYQPGTVISKKTVQIEKPKIVANPQSFSGIPAGGSTSFQVTISNESETGEDLWFDLLVAADSNPDGLSVTMDDTSLNYGTTVLVKAGEPLVKTITISQSNPDVLSYKDVKIRVASQCQKDNTSTYHEIADTTSFSAYFQPACSDIYLESSHALVNTDTKTPVTLSVSKYNYAMTSLTAVELQYKGANDTEFKTLKKYVKDQNQLNTDPSLGELKALQDGAKLTYPLDLRTNDFNDKTYIFRAVTVCNLGGVLVNNESNEVEIVRDMARPMLIASPTPSSGVYTSSDDLLITFNEDILSANLSKDNFNVTGVLNESKVQHDVALKLSGSQDVKTESTIDLSGKSFSASMWVNYSTDGKLLMHGTKDQNFTVAIEDGKLAVSVAGKKTTSTQTLPKDKWLYLNVSYDAETKTINAGYAVDASSVTLMNNLESKAYEGNGPISLGGDNLNAKVQELAIWNSARSLSQAQGTMNTTKSKYTSGLIGYWQLNEGHGDVATDKARSRNMTLPSENAWWIDGDNYALTLDGTKTAAVRIASLNTTDNDDYLVETWFKADEQQTGTVSVMSTLKMNLRLNERGKMDVVLNGDNTAAGYENNASTLVYDKDLRDGQWHHVAVNVLKGSNGSGVIYVDGQQRKQIGSAEMPELFGDNLLLGGMRVEQSYGVYSYAQLLKGAFDEVRIWKGRRTADVIKNNMYQRISAKEAGLEAYYPMEKLVEDSYGQLISTATFNDTVTAGTSAAAKLEFYTADGTKVSGQTADLSKAHTAALKPAPKTEKVSFSYVASERQIKVNIDEDAYKIEGCNLTISVEDVKDTHANKAEPITWSVYVQRNKLHWQESDMAVSKTGGEDAKFSATIENIGSESENWSLSGMPSWLSANVEAGSLMPLSTAKLTFTVDESLPIGTYETTVYLTGSQNINAPLNITVTSKGDAPDWAVTPGESSMIIVGVLNINGVQSSDPNDIIAAFRGTECVGVAKPEYLSRFDSYMVMMTIYGNAESQLTYKAYDASTGTIYPSVSVSDQSAYTFVSDKNVGSFTSPVVFTPLNEIEQDLSNDRASWKWFSLYAQPKENKPSVVFKDAQSAITAISDGTNTITSWIGNLNSFAFDKMYKLNASAPYVESVIGEPTDPTTIDITLKSGWSWIGYPCQASNSLDAAFAGAEPNEGDVVKSQSRFAIYTEGEWVGMLTSMQPGVGYMYQNTLANTKTFRYPKPVMSGRANARQLVNGVTDSFNAGSRDNMTMIAVVMDGDKLIEDAQVSVYAGTELRGHSNEAVRDGRHFLTIGGQAGEGEVLNFVVSTDRGEFFLAQTETFKADVMMGSVSKPYVLRLGETTDIDMAANGTSIKCIRIYDGGGRLVLVDEHPSHLYTKNDLKHLPAGVYYQQVVYKNDLNRVLKVMW